MILIPELTIYNLVQGMIKHLRQDYLANTVTPTKSMLHYIFEGLALSRKDYYDEAVAILMKGQESPRHLDTRLYYDRERATIPTIHITIPQEQHSENTIGDFYDYTDIEDTDNTNTYRPNIERRYDATTHVIVTSDNENEVTIIYHALRAMMQSAIGAIQLVGLENPKLSGQEIRISEELAPNHIYHRGIGVQYSYIVSVPRWFDDTQMKNILLFKKEQDVINSTKLKNNV